MSEKNLEKCDMCFGRGWDENPGDPCIYCKGSGFMKVKVVEGEVKEAKEEAPEETPEVETSEPEKGK